MEVGLAPDYIIYNNGIIYSTNRIVDTTTGYKRFLESKIKKTTTEKNGYERVGLYINKKIKFFYIHRLVAMAYIPNPYNLPLVNHIDKNRKNNNVSNLEWCDSMYNNQSINTCKNFGNVGKTPSNTYRVIYASNGVKHSQTFKTEDEAISYLFVKELFLKLEL